MAEVKVVAISGEAAEKLLAAITGLLGGQELAPAPVEPVVLDGGEVDEDPDFEDLEVSDEEEGCGDETCSLCYAADEDLAEEDPEVALGTVLEDNENDSRYKRSYFVGDVEPVVTVTSRGILVQVEDFSDTIAPQGAFDQVTALVGGDTLTVRLYKLGEEGREVEVEYV